MNGDWKDRHIRYFLPPVKAQYNSEYAVHLHLLDPGRMFVV